MYILWNFTKLTTVPPYKVVDLYALKSVSVWSVFVSCVLVLTRVLVLVQQRRHGGVNGGQHAPNALLVHGQIWADTRYVMVHGQIRAHTRYVMVHRQIWTHTSTRYDMIHRQIRAHTRYDMIHGQIPADTRYDMVHGQIWAHARYDTDRYDPIPGTIWYYVHGQIWADTRYDMVHGQIRSHTRYNMVHGQIRALTIYLSNWFLYIGTQFCVQFLLSSIFIYSYLFIKHNAVRVVNLNPCYPRCGCYLRCTYCTKMLPLLSAL